jgi:WD40 repeat protein
MLHTLVGPRDGVTALTFQPGGTLLAAADFNGEMLVWDASDGRILHLINANEDQERFTALTFSPDGSMIVGGALNGDAVFWNATDGVEVARVSVSLQPILALAFSPSGQQLAASVRNESASVYTLEVPK